MYLYSARILLIPLLLIVILHVSCLGDDCKEEIHLTVGQLSMPDTVDHFRTFTIEFEVGYASGHSSWKELSGSFTDNGYILQAIGNFDKCITAHCMPWNEWRSEQLFAFRKGILRIEIDNPRTESIVDSVFVR